MKKIRLCGEITNSPNPRISLNRRNRCAQSPPISFIPSFCKAPFAMCTLYQFCATKKIGRNGSCPKNLRTRYSLSRLLPADIPNFDFAPDYNFPLSRKLDDIFKIRKCNCARNFGAQIGGTATLRLWQFLQVRALNR